MPVWAIHRRQSACATKLLLALRRAIFTSSISCGSLRTARASPPLKHCYVGKARCAVPSGQPISLLWRRELTLELGEFVLRRACRDALNWPQLVVSVNVSALQLQDPHFADFVETALRERSFPRVCGCHSLQGYLISRPVSALAISHMLTVGQIDGRVGENNPFCRTEPIAVLPTPVGAGIVLAA